LDKLLGSTGTDFNFESGTNTINSQTPLLSRVSGMPYGNYYLIAVINESKSIPESNYENNVFMTPVILETPLGGLESTEQENEESFHLYPNPNQGVFTIHGLKNEYIVEVFDLIGTKVYQGSEESEQISLQKVPVGIYQVTIKNKSGKYLFGSKMLIKNE
jgi:hypothetical protein